MIKDNHLLCHIIDVDMMGSGIFIQTTEYNILIDLAYETGTVKVINYLKEINVKDLDLVVITHPHRDHMAGQGQGGLSKFISNFNIGEIWSNGVPLPTWYNDPAISPDGPDSIRDYDLYLSQIFPQGYTVGGVLDYPTIQGISIISYVEPSAGDVFNFGELAIKVFNPQRPHKKAITNETSIVMQLSYKGKKIMFCGDSSSGSEADILQAFTALELKSDILYLGHHGIDDATSMAWYNAVNPSVVTVQRRDHMLSNRILTLIGNTPIYDPYNGEDYFTMNRDSFTNYVFDISETDIQIYTRKSTKSVSGNTISDIMIKDKGELRKISDILVKSNNKIIKVKNMTVKS